VSETERDPYAEGVEAHDAGHSDTANPYDFDHEHDEWESWMDGWNIAAENATDDELDLLATTQGEAP
jgi:hypothetical protein